MTLTREQALELSTPDFCGFDPTIIPWQMDVISCLQKWDYSKSTPEVLFSGTFGSAKSVLLSHLIIKHCVENDGARFAIGRKALPDLKRTLYAEILEHMEVDFIEGVDFIKSDTIGKIVFRNGSEIISVSWADKKYMKFRSLKLSGLAITEVVENNKEDMEAFKQLKARVRRLPEVKENMVLCDTNPDSPGHWVFKYWLEKNHPTRPVFYSLLEQNPFLDPVYREQLAADLSPREADRYLRGLWCDIITERIYYCYDTPNKRDETYSVDCNYPIHLAWDFNIADGKPLSMCCNQFIPSDPSNGGLPTFHIFNEVVVEGMRTAQSCEELAEKGVLHHNTRYIVNGDATGRAKSTRSNKSDYDLIMKYLSNYEYIDDYGQTKKLDVKLSVPLANPPIRTRHNTVNTWLCNDEGKRRVFVYREAPTVDEGLRLSKLVKGGSYLEDDKDPYQHVTTALGYSIFRTLKQTKIPKQHTKLL